MGFYLRKSVSVGPFRFNLSGSGVGVSAGIKGFRVGTGPRGNYIHLGRGGLYYRATLPTPQRQPSTPPAVPTPTLPGDGLEEIESGSALAMVDSSSAVLLEEINSKAKMWRLWSAAVFMTIVLFYEMEPECEAAYQRLHNIFDQILACQRKWHIEARGDVRTLQEWKTSGGASSIVRRRTIVPRKSAPPYFKTNVSIPVIPAGSQTMYFFPDRLLVYAPEGVGAVSYETLVVGWGDSRFIEEDGVPPDARIVDTTWRYVNKSGGPDRRYNNNRQIPVALYGVIEFTSSTGLRERLQLSRTGLGPELEMAVQNLSAALRQPPASPAALVTCPCNNCSGYLDAPITAIGQVVQCPHCGLQTKVFRPAISQPPKLRPEPPPAPSNTQQTVSEYDPSELLQVCDSILEDGEISGDEAYALSTWLNEHKEACLHWPGDSLVQLLQQIWADGKVTKTELRQLARALVRIRKESVKRKSQRAADEAIVAAKQIFRSFDLSQAAVPLVRFTAEIKSHSERGLRYHVDLSLPSCTCPDFMTRRQSLPIGHINRCCKHVFDSYRQLVSPEGWLRAFVENGWPAHPNSEWAVVPVGGGYVLVSTAPNGWSNIYAANGDEYGRYGYNLAEERWAYGEAPDKAERILDVVRQVCRIR